MIAQRDHHLKVDEERTMLDLRIGPCKDTLTATSGELNAAIDLRECLETDK